MKPRQLQIGDHIPDFWTRDISGKEVDARNLKSTTLFVFLRYAGCPFCNLAVFRLSHEYKLLQKNNCNVIAFIQSTEENIEEHVISQQQIKPPFPIVPDQAQDIYKLFGVAPDVKKTAKFTVKNASHWIDAVFKKKFKQTSFDGQSFIVPAYFLVDKSGRIELANYDASFYEDEVFTPIYEHLNFGPSF